MMTGDSQPVDFTDLFRRVELASVASGGHRSLASGRCKIKGARRTGTQATMDHRVAEA